MVNSTPIGAEAFVRTIANHPHFDSAALIYLEAFVSWRRGLGGFNKVVCSAARQRIMRSILTLHFGNATENPDDGATFERLLNRATVGVPCGPRVLRTVISLAQRTGHVSVQRGRYDRRLKVLRPSERWIADEAERHEAALSCLALLGRTPVATRPHGAELVRRLAANLDDQPGAGLALGDPDGALRNLAALDGGLATSLAVADAWGRGRRPPSHKELGVCFRLSASQARKILRLAADQGLIAFDRDGRIADASGMVAEARRLIARDFALYASATSATAASSAGNLPALALTESRPSEHAH